MVVMSQTREIMSEGTASFFQALKRKYVEQEEVDNEFVLPRDRAISTDITFVGFGKVLTIQKQLKQLVNIDLSHQEIDSAELSDELEGCLQKVKILNLAYNRLRWNDIITILEHVPNLRELILTENDLSQPANFSSQLQPRAPLCSLTCGGAKLDWNNIIATLSRIWIRVDQLDLWSSSLNEDSMILRDSRLQDFTSRIRVLRLSHNHFSTIDWISNAGSLNQLIEIDLSNCHMTSMKLNDKISKAVANLRILNISYNDINDWSDISSLFLLKDLKTLICHENPFYITTKHSKALVIGRLGSLTNLNREDISKNARRDSDIFYFKTTCTEYSNLGQNEHESFHNRHPRFKELIGLYGDPDIATTKPVRDKSITVNLIHDTQTVSKKLPCDMRVANVKMLCKRLFKLRPTCSIEISCVKTDSETSYVLDKDSQTLDFFSIENGSDLIIAIV